MRIFLDANVLFSASLRERSRQYAFFALARSGHCRLTSSAYALEEARRNVARKAASRLTVLDVLTRLVEPSAAPPGDFRGERHSHPAAVIGFVEPQTPRNGQRSTMPHSRDS